MDISLRYATKDDAALIADISHDTFYEAFHAENRPEDMEKFLREQFTKGRLMMEVGAPENIFLLAYSQNQVAGYLKLRDGRVPQSLGGIKALEVARLYAFSRFIGAGVGRALMQASVDIAMERNKEAIWLGVWEKNLRAIGFYKKWGFEKFDETDFLLGDDLQRDWLMVKRLSKKT